MNDLISREEVLNLIDTAFESGAFDGRYAYENLIDAVQNLIHPLETDCISRQAAIDAFERFIHELGIKDEPYNYGEMALSEQNVPSVEPEKCGDCISRAEVLSTYADWYGYGYNNGFYRLVQQMKSVEPEQKGRECASCKHSNNGECAYTEKCHECMWESQYEQQVEPERKTGKWIDGKCNKCGANAPFWPMASTYYCSEYCPKCGAKMEVDTNGTE